MPHTACPQGHSVQILRKLQHPYPQGMVKTYIPPGQLCSKQTQGYPKKPFLRLTHVYSIDTTHKDTLPLIWGAQRLQHPRGYPLILRVPPSEFPETYLGYTDCNIHMEVSISWAAPTGAMAPSLVCMLRVFEGTCWGYGKCRVDYTNTESSNSRLERSTRSTRSRESAMR